MNNSCYKLQESECLPPSCKYINGSKLKYCRKATTLKGNRSASIGTTVRCKKIPQENCLLPDCKYINGPKLKYCRRATTVRRRVKIDTPASRLKTPSSKPKTPSPSPKINATRRAAQKIQSFMNKKRSNITALFLNSVCQESGVCFAFGKESAKIKSFFDNFTSFKYATNHKQISSGVNGDVYEVAYERLKYKSFAILKIAKKKTSDNLLYEYLAGMFVNSKYKKTPALLETYGLYNKVLNAPLVDLNSLTLINTNTQPEIDSAISLACLQPTTLCNLIEHIKGSATLFDKMNDYYFVKYDVIYALFQVYFTLNMMKDLFTHYDLHGMNVLVYIPVPDKYIQYHYHSTTSVVSFKSPYMVKIIDYGRSYFNHVEKNVESEEIRKLICAQPDCNIPPSKCGETSGFGWLNTKSAKSSWFINSSAINRSHDVRLLTTLIDYLKTWVIHPAIPKIIKANKDLDLDTNKNINLLFGRAKLKYTTKYGTPQLLTSGLPKKINNIMDAFSVLQSICANQSFVTQNDTCYNIGEHREAYGKIGDLHIYDDGSNKDMEFVAV